MKLAWWKWLAVALMFYVLLAGMLIPLKTGIQAVSPQTLVLGQPNTLLIEGYNSGFADKAAPKVWLKLSSEVVEQELAIAATSVKVLGPQELKATFSVPAGLPPGLRDAYASLIVDSPGDGAFVMPSAIAITKAGVPSAAFATAWATPIGAFSASEGLTFPYRALLGETIRNQYFHVSLWFALMLLMGAAAWQAFKYLRTSNPEADRRSEALTRVGLLFGLLGLVTGMVWANYTWGKPWSGDVKQNMTAIALLIYLAYFVLRASLPSIEAARRAGAAYNLFAFAMLIPLLYVIPRMRESLHPGAGGNPGFGGEDLDSTMRMVFYPGIIGFTLLGLWLAQLWWRSSRIAERLEAA